MDTSTPIPLPPVALMPATHDFGRGPVPAARHTNPDGSEGGWVAATASVSPRSYVASRAKVYDTAVLHGDARALDNSRVYGEAYISGGTVRGDARVCGSATVWNGVIRDSAVVRDRARVGRGAVVGGTTWVDGRALLSQGACILKTEDLAAGTLGGYAWTSWWDEGANQRVLRYGCERHPLSWWLAQDLPELSRDHGHDPEHAHYTRTLVAMLAELDHLQGRNPTPVKTDGGV